LLVTLTFFPADFFLDDGLRDAAFLREAADLARFFVAAFLAAIVDSCGPRKTRDYTLTGHTWKPKTRLFCTVNSRQRMDMLPQEIPT
jgi:hypothetical protein